MSSSLLHRLCAVALILTVGSTACSSSVTVPAETAVAAPPQGDETSMAALPDATNQADPTSATSDEPASDETSPERVPVDAPEPDPTSTPEPQQEPVELPARARFDQIVIDLHATSGSASAIPAFHDAARGWCGSSLGAPSISNTDREVLDALTADDCALLTDHGEDAATGLTDWNEIVDARWAQVVWWEDRASFQAELEAMCVATSALDLRFEGFSVSANDQYLSARYSGECRYFGQPDATNTASSASSDPANPAELTGSVFVTHENAIAVLDLESDQETSVVRVEGDVDDATLSPAGDLIAFSSQDAEDDQVTHLWVLDIRSGECRHIGEQHGGFKQHQWSPQGDRFITGIWDRDVMEERIELVGRDGSLSVIAEGGYFSRIPDGAWIDDSRIVFGMNRPGSKVQWQIRDVETGDAALVGLASGSPQGSVAADGSTLVFTADNDLHIVRDLDEIELAPWLSTELLAQRPTDAPSTFVGGSSWKRGLEISPDGSHLLYASLAGLLTVTGAQVVPLDEPDSTQNLAPTELLVAGETYHGVSVWSPDSAAAIVEISPDQRITNRMSVAFTLDGQRVDLGTAGQAFAWVDGAPGVIEQGQCSLPGSAS